MTLIGVRGNALIFHFHSLRPGVLLRNFKFESPHFVVERHACATPLRGAGKIFRPFFQNDKNNALTNKWCVSHFFRDLVFCHEIFGQVAISTDCWMADKGMLLFRCIPSRGSFSAVSKPNVASEYAFESSRRDLHDALLYTALQSHFCQNSAIVST